MVPEIPRHTSWELSAVHCDAKHTPNISKTYPRDPGVQTSSIITSSLRAGLHGKVARCKARNIGAQLEFKINQFVYYDLYTTTFYADFSSEVYRKLLQLLQPFDVCNQFGICECTLHNIDSLLDMSCIAPLC